MQQTKRLTVVILGKWRIIRVKNAVDAKEFVEIPPFANSMIKPRIQSRKSQKAQQPSGTSQEFQKTKSAIESSKIIAHTMLIKWSFL
jgi:hypothetical protein